MNIHWIYCIENIFTVQDFLATCACLQKQSFTSIFSLYWMYFLPFKLLSNSALTLKNRVCPEIFHCIQYTFYIQDFRATCAFPELAVLNIHFYSDVRWGSWLVRHYLFQKFASVWIEWSSIKSPLNWLLAECLLLMLSIPYHNFVHTYRCNGDSTFEKSNI